MKYVTAIVIPILLFMLKSTLEKVRDFDVKSLDRMVQTGLQKQAFTVLEERCNVCHVNKRRTDVFTLENMDSLAVDINEQVFIKRKMPKGRKIKLIESETELLKLWLADTLAEKE